MYTSSQLRVLLVFTPIATALVGLVVLAIFSCSVRLFARRRVGKSLPIRRTPATRVLASLLASGLTLLLLQSTLSSLSLPPPFLVVILASLVAISGLVAAAESGMQMLNTLLLVMLALASVEWARDSWRSADGGAASWNEVDKKLNEKIQFISKPNVYLVHLESYSNEIAMREIYGFENRQFLEALEQRRFTIYPNHFSNHAYTMTSIATLFAMRHHHFRVALGNMDGVGIRDMVGGKLYNPVLDVFKRNGYEAQIIHQSDYMFIRGAALSYAYPRRTAAKVFEIYQIDQLNDLLARIFTSYAPAARGSRVDSIAAFANLNETLKERVWEAATSSNPYFSFLAPMGTQHSNANKSWDELAGFVDEYPARIAKANPTFLELFDWIIENDPEAVVIVYGDHGASRYRGIENGEGDFNETLAKRGLSAETFALDRFGTMLAIRFPNGDPSLFENTSPVNLFRILFSALAEDPTILETMAPNESYVRRNKKFYVGVREGRPLAAWQPFEKPAAN